MDKDNNKNHNTDDIKIVKNNLDKTCPEFDESKYSYEEYSDENCPEEDYVFDDEDWVEDEDVCPRDSELAFLEEARERGYSLASIMPIIEQHISHSELEELIRDKLQDIIDLEGFQDVEELKYNNTRDLLVRAVLGATISVDRAARDLMSARELPIESSEYVSAFINILTEYISESIIDTVLSYDEPLYDDSTDFLF